MSGVSTGTVDRFLHKRGKVSEEAQKKVEKVLKEIDYQPNLIARSLALKKNYHLISILPSFAEGEYWDKVSKGIEKAEKAYMSYNVVNEHLYFNQFDQSTFDALIPRIKEIDCQGVVIATLFRDSVLQLTQLLDDLDIPYVLIDAFVENTNCLSFFGTNSFDSGYIAGRLLLEQIRKTDDLALFRFIRQGENNMQMSNREAGFRDYMERHDYEGQIHLVKLHADEVDKNAGILDNFLMAHPNVDMGIIFNSRAYLLGDYFLSKHTDFHIIGYDELDANLKHLQNGCITHLIGQRPEVQGYNSVRSLFKHLVLHEDDEKMNYMPIDILIKENIRYYNNYI